MFSVVDGNILEKISCKSLGYVYIIYIYMCVDIDMDIGGILNIYIYLDIDDKLITGYALCFLFPMFSGGSLS